ncbi:mitochondrial carnitine/acylcarnitine carrier protein-like [Dysidea avara]|uniref:mitochondrial carnitine/acylcarnitine carrier protein-like n=1 Tax=Dysidea avara TaxID=196820 RepID=UPI00331A7802
MAGEKVKYEDPSSLKSFIAGGIGGMVEVTVGHPLDTVKVRLQAMPPPLPGQPAVFTNMFQCIRSTLHNEGVRGLYRGLLSPLAAITPMCAVYFLGYSTGKKLQMKNSDDILSLRQHFVAGMMGGVYSCPMCAPVERVKCVMQIQRESKLTSKYSSSWDCARQLYRQGGVATLYRGTIATLLRDAPASGINFLTYEWFLRVLTPEGKCHHDLNPMKTMAAGGFAGVFCHASTVPMDTIKSRYQTAPDGVYSGALSVAKEMIKEEGLLRIFRGATPILIRSFPANAGCFLGYETAIKLMNYLSL